MYKEKYIQEKELLNDYNKRIKEKEKDLEKKEVNLQLHLEALKWLFYLRTNKINDKREKIIQMITLGCQDIFEKNYELKILTNDELGESSLKEIKYNIILYKNGIEIAKNEKLLESNGGGVLSVISVLIKIIINIIYSKEKFFIFDESMSQVSKKYQEKLSLFIKKLCEKQDLTIVLITHVDDFAIHADYIYNFKGSFDKDNIAVLNIEKQDFINKYPKYRLELKNFQSIKNITLDFKGFTVIKGQNDIGKSAIVRAVNSILYNDFKENYVRINKPKREKTEIKFEKLLSEKEKQFSIQLIKSSTGITYIINGEELRGKQLAKDAIKEELKKNGFGNFLDEHNLSDFSVLKRNKLGNIAITNQNDQLYLLNNTSNENNKIISYIFQANIINNAILRIKDIIKDMKKENSFLEKEVRNIKDKKNIKEKQLEYLYLKYFYEVLSTFQNKQQFLLNINKQQSFFQNKQKLLNKKIIINKYKLNSLKAKNINKIIKNIDKNFNLIKNKIKYYNIIYQIKKLKIDKRKEEKLNIDIKNININKSNINKKIDNISKNILILKINILHNKIIKLNSIKIKRKNILNNINNIDKNIKNVNKYVKIKNILNKIINLKNKNNDFNKKYIETKNLYNKIDIQLKELKEKHICPKCQGKGYIL